MTGVKDARVDSSPMAGMDYVDYIVNGMKAERGEVPWLAKMVYKGKADCDGTLVGRKHIITAAHCILHQGMLRQAKDYVIILGHHDHEGGREHTSGLRVKVQKIILHPQYNSTTVANDIAILVLSKDVPFKDTINPACLPNKGSSLTRFLDKPVTISGWGFLSLLEDRPDFLQKATVVVQGKDCGKYTKDQIQTGMFCAGDPSNTGMNVIDACTGDSGGPATVKDDRNKNAETLIGVISWGQECGREDYPGVYTDVSHYMNWLLENMEGLVTCRKYDN